MMEQIKPEVIGYNRVYSDGDVWPYIIKKGHLNIVWKNSSESINVHKNGKQKFRLVYKKDIK